MARCGKFAIMDNALDDLYMYIYIIMQSAVKRKPETMQPLLLCTWVSTCTCTLGSQGTQPYL